MRSSQYVRGLQLKFGSKEESAAFLQELAVFFNSRTTKIGKPEGTLHPSLAKLYVYKGGLTICWCQDELKHPSEILITVPYIIVDGQTIHVPPNDVMINDDNGVGKDALKSFIRRYWEGNNEPLKPIATRQSAEEPDLSLFPKMMVDLVCTLKTFYDMGQSDASFENEDIPDYLMSLRLRQIAANNIKDVGTFYEFLDKSRQRSCNSPLNTMEYEEAVSGIRNSCPRVYMFLEKRGFLTNKKSIKKGGV